MKSSPTTSLREGDSAAAFISLIQAGISKLVEAAHMLKRLVDSDKQTIEKIRAIDPTISASVLTKLLLVAEGSLMPELLLNSAPVFKRLQSLPITVQRTVLSRGSVNLVVNASTGDHVCVPLVDVEASQISQLFDGFGLRDIDAQRAFLRRQLSAIEVEGTDYPWVVKKGKCIIVRPCELTKKELRRILDEMK